MSELSLQIQLRFSQFAGVRSFQISRVALRQFEFFTRTFMSTRGVDLLDLLGEMHIPLFQFSVQQFPIFAELCQRFSTLLSKVKFLFQS